MVVIRSNRRILYQHSNATCKVFVRIDRYRRRCAIILVCGDTLHIFIATVMERTAIIIRLYTFVLNETTQNDCVTYPVVRTNFYYNLVSTHHEVEWYQIIQNYWLKTKLPFEWDCPINKIAEIKNYNTQWIENIKPFLLTNLTSYMSSSITR